MLDDLKFIHEKDAQDALGIAEKQWQQIEHEFQVKVEPRQFENIVFAGMGGSALAALLVQTWPGVNVPSEIVRNYSLPGYVSEKTLFITSSYSGNTEEVLSALSEAEQKKAHIVAITSGGKLAEIAKQKQYTLVELPANFQPRYAVLYNFKASVKVLDAYGITNSRSSELNAAAEFLKQSSSAWRPDVPTGSNLAKQIAQELMGKSVVIYGGPIMAAAAYKWRNSICENAKHLAWSSLLPEANHTEILGWTEQPVQKPYAIVDLRSSLEHPRIQKRFEITEKLLSGRRPSPIVVVPKGETLLEQLLYTVALGDFVSLYLALLNGLNPTPVELIEKLKKELAE